MTGDPSWIRGDIRPRVAISLEFQSGIPEDEQARSGDGRRRSWPPTATAAACRIRCSHEVLLEMMEFLGCRTLERDARGRCSSTTCSSTVPTAARSPGATEFPSR